MSRVGLDWAIERMPRPPSGEPELVRARAWSTVYRIPTGDGPLWFKANGGDTRYEARLARALAQWVPDRVLTPLAVHAEQGWQLLPDGGPTLRELDANREHRAWERFAGAYAELQRVLTRYAKNMLDLGVPDHRPAALPAHFAALLDDPTVAIAGERRAALRGLTQRYADACARLAEAGPEPTLQHDDLHSNNVFRDGRFFDWGDASVGHPFHSLLVALRSMAATFDVAPGDPVLERFRDAYLEPWSLGAEGPALVELAVWTGIVGRSLSWRRALTEAGPAELDEFGDAVGGWLEELLF